MWCTRSSAQPLVLEPVKLNQTTTPQSFSLAQAQLQERADNLLRNLPSRKIIATTEEELEFDEECGEEEEAEEERPLQRDECTDGEDLEYEDEEENSEELESHEDDGALHHP